MSMVCSARLTHAQTVFALSYYGSLLVSLPLCHSATWLYLKYSKNIASKGLCLQAASGGSTATAAAQLQALSRLANQAVGDAISGLLMVEAALSIMKLDLQSWGSLYADLPSKQLKVRALPCCNRQLSCPGFCPLKFSTSFGRPT